MTTYPPKTLLRFFPSLDSAAHYTAIVLADDRIYQIKSPANETVYFDTMEAWLESLPGSPSADALMVSTKDEEKKQKESTKPKKKKFNVPTKYETTYTPLKWGRHVYYSMKELAPSLLQQEEVMDAYNAFIEVLSVPHPTVYISVPQFNKKYLRGISMEGFTVLPVQYSFSAFHSGKMVNQADMEENKKLIDGYRAAYLPLYDRIKRDIIPVIDRLREERYSKRLVDHHNKLLTKTIHAQVLLQQRFNHQMKHIQNRIAEHVKAIDIYKVIKTKTYEWDVGTK
jgi:hypothetical protein